MKHNPQEIKVIREFLFDLVSIESPPGNEATAAKFVASAFEELGYRSHLQYLHELSFNMIINNNKSPGLLIATHIDTVPVISAPKIIDDHYICGTGAVDAKGSIAAIYYALRKLEDLPDKVSIAIFSEEETSGGGAITYLADHKPKYVLVMEPTKLMLANSSTGFIEINLVIQSLHYHPDLIAHYDEDTSAPRKTLDLLQMIDQFLKERGLTYAITNLSAKGNVYFVPSECEVSINIHVPPSEKALTIYNALRSKIKNFRGVRIQLNDFSDPFRVENKKLLSIVSHAYQLTFNKEPEWVTMLSWTDATSFVEYGIPSIIFGPGDPALAHNENERIDVRDVIAAGEFLLKIIQLVEHSSL